MPEEITTALTDYQAAALNVANAEDAHEAASEEYEQAGNRLEAAQLALEDAAAAEKAARQRYISALRRNGWVRTADGPKPADWHQGACQCEHADHFPVMHPDDTQSPAPDHSFGEVPAGGRRASFVGPVCDSCAYGHMADYLARCPENSQWGTCDRAAGHLSPHTAGGHEWAQS